MIRFLACAAVVLSVSGLSACGTADDGPGGPVGSESGGITVQGSASGSAGANGVIFLYLPGHVECPSIGSYNDGQAYSSGGQSLGSAQMAGLQDGRAANAGGGGNALSNDAFFNNVALGDFTICARPADDVGVCLAPCNTARAIGTAVAAHKTHVNLIMTCKTPPTQDVGAVVSIQNTPSIDLTGAVETGLVSCGGSSSASTLTATGNIVSPDGTASEYLAAFDGPAPAGVTLSPMDWTAAAGGSFSVTLHNNSGAAASAPIKIRARIKGLDGAYIYADDYTLTFSWLDCL